jgi:xylan 1,4-beta-xylosidase
LELAITLVIEVLGWIPYVSAMMGFRPLLRTVPLRRLSLALILTVVTTGLGAQEASPTSIQIHADGHDTGTPLKHFWSTTVGAGRANEGLRASWQEQLHTAVSNNGFRYVRFHGLFHDDMFVYHENHGIPVYNFQYIDDLFDRMLENGARPFVELSFFPSDMAARKGSVGFWWGGNGSPPSDYSKWTELVRHFAQHCISRYGPEEVRSWYFEVWNEPDLDQGFFTGTQTQYFELYKSTALTLKAVDPQLRVGGPATSNFHVPDEIWKKAEAEGTDPLALHWYPTWIEDFFFYCKKNSLPVDFISTHPYPMDMQYRGKTVHRSVNSTHDDLLLLRKMVDASPFPHAEIHLTEWSSSPSSRDHTHDSLPAAAYVVKCNLDSIGLVDSLSYWTFTDVFEEQGAGDTIFHGGFGMINYQGIPKPVFHGYRFLNALGDELLGRSSGAIITRDHNSGRLTALAYNYPVDVPYSLPGTSSLAEADQIAAMGTAAQLSIELSGLPPNAPVLIETLDKEHGNATRAWEEMGQPPMPTREQTEALRNAAWGTAKELVHADASGRLVFQRELEAWSLVLIRQL